MVVHIRWSTSKNHHHHHKKKQMVWKNQSKAPQKKIFSIIAIIIFFSPLQPKAERTTSSPPPSIIVSRVFLLIFLRYLRPPNWLGRSMFYLFESTTTAYQYRCEQLSSHVKGWHTKHRRTAPCLPPISPSSAFVSSFSCTPPPSSTNGLTCTYKHMHTRDSLYLLYVCLRLVSSPFSLCFDNSYYWDHFYPFIYIRSRRHKHKCS